MSWWDWGELGPWNVPLDQIREVCGERFYRFRKGSFVEEPVSGRLMYTKNRGDYTIGDQWGGPQKLAQYVEDVRSLGALPMFYMEGILACATTQVAKHHALDQAVMDPAWANPNYEHYCPRVPEGYVGQWASFGMCADARFWPDYLAETVARVCQQTGVDGVRLDEYGHRGWVCHSPHHEHIFAEPGHNAWMQATARTCRLVHEAMDQVRPGLVLTTEYPGTDFFAANIEGALFHEGAVTRIHAVRPVPCNLFRFYFRHCKPFDLSRKSQPHYQAVNLFNASATFAGDSRHPDRVHHTLRENTDAFEGERIEPLVSTLIPLVYANRFEGGGKVIYTIHNAVGYTVEGPVLAVDTDEEHHWVNLIRGEELKIADTAAGPALTTQIRRNETMVAARLRHELRVEGGTVGLAEGSAGGEVVVCDACCATGSSST